MHLPKLKRDAAPELVAHIDQIEQQCDAWADNLVLFRSCHDVAAWGVLTQIIDLIEQQVRQYGHGSYQQREAMINLGRAGALLLNRIRSSHLAVRDAWLRWTPELKDATREAVFAAHNCETFASCFTTWHQNRRSVELLSPTRIRFSVPPSAMDRRVQAYQQGRRIADWPSTPDNPVGRSFVNTQGDNQSERFDQQIAVLRVAAS
jgi:hypothetical protein